MSTSMESIPWGEAVVIFFAIIGAICAIAAKPKGR